MGKKVGPCPRIGYKGEIGYPTPLMCTATCMWEQWDLSDCLDQVHDEYLKLDLGLDYAQNETFWSDLDFGHVQKESWMKPVKAVNDRSLETQRESVSPDGINYCPFTEMKVVLFLQLSFL